MKLYQKVLLIWVPLIILNAACASLEQSGGSSPIGWMLLRDAGALLAVLSFVLYKKELRRNAKFVFLGFCVFFAYIGMFNPTVELMMYGLHLWDESSVGYWFQYSMLSYNFLMSFSVIFLVAGFALRKWNTYQRFLITMIVVGTSWGYLYYPYLADPKYLYTVKDIRAYVAISNAIQKLEKSAKSEPTVSQIASVAEFHSPGGAKAEMTPEEREAYVAEILPYLRGDDYIPLVFRPLYWANMAISVVCVIFVLCLILYKYVADPPEGAYIEKIVWFVLLFCGFEVLHNYAFATARTNTTLAELYIIGHYVTLAVMVILVFLFIVRLRFIRSVEGGYYERQLIIDANHVTRWRDVFDNWILRQFMKPDEFDRRFLIRR